MSGNWRNVTRGIEKLLKKNNAFVSVDAIFEYTNSVWCERDPNRCMSPAERSKAMKSKLCYTCGAKRRVR